MMVSSNQNQASGNHSKQNQERPTRRQKSRALAMATLELVRANVPRRGIRPGTHRIFYDQTNQGYGWLLPGWVAEERVMPVSGRTYRLYYDPTGRQYSTQAEVLHAWEQSGLIVLDLD